MYYVKDFDLDSKLDILHSNNCNTKLCIEVDHLRTGEQRENTKDALDRGWKPFEKVNVKKLICDKCGSIMTKSRTQNYCRKCKSKRQQELRHSKK